uniref:Uncharacterized protein n=1 Tax=Magallana gigas TaxID=29159 RepID=K1PQ53_MAGGI
MYTHSRGPRIRIQLLPIVQGCCMRIIKNRGCNIKQGPSGDTVCDESAVCEPCIDLSGIHLLSDGSQENGASLQSFRRLLLSR